MYYEAERVAAKKKGFVAGSVGAAVSEFSTKTRVLLVLAPPETLPHSMGETCFECFSHIFAGEVRCRCLGGLLEHTPAPLTIG